MVREKMPDTVNKLGFRVARLDAAFIESMTPLDADDIRAGRLQLVGHWNALAHAKSLMEELDLKGVILVLDEADDLITNKDTVKETYLREIMAGGRLHSTISVSATQLGWIMFTQQFKFPIHKYITCTHDDLVRLQYRGIDRIVILKDAAGDPVWIPEEPVQPKRAQFDCKDDFKAAQAVFKCEKYNYPFSMDYYYGIKSEEVKVLFDSFNQCDRPFKMLFLSLGGLVEKGSEVQAKLVVSVLSPQSKVILISAGMVREFAMDPVTNTVVGTVVKTSATSSKRLIKASIRQALKKYDNDPNQSVVVLSQGCTKRGVSVCTSLREITHQAVFATGGIPLADFFQLVGRCTGKGFKGDVISLFQEVDYKPIMHLDKFTTIACHEAIKGNDIMTSTALADPKFMPLMDMIRPFNKKEVLDKMPVVAKETRKRRREADAAQNRRTRHAPQLPEQPAPQLPEGTPQLPEQPAPQLPERPGPQLPEGMPSMPDHPVPQLPEGMPSMPDHPVPQLPEGPASQLPEHPVSQLQEGPAPPMPFDIAPPPKAVAIRIPSKSKAYAYLAALPAGAEMKWMARGAIHTADGKGGCTSREGVAYDRIVDWGTLTEDTYQLTRRAASEKPTNNHGINWGTKVHVNVGGKWQQVHKANKQ
jgi:hypothetical protein